MYRHRIISPNTRNRRANMILYGSPNSPDYDKVTWKDAPFLGLETNSFKENIPEEHIYFQRSTLQDRENYDYIRSRLPELRTTNFRKNVKTDIDFNLDEPEGESLKRKKFPSTGKSCYECLSLSIINLFLFILNILFIYSS